MTTFEIIESESGTVVSTATSQPLAQGVLDYLQSTTLKAHHLRAVSAATRTPEVTWENDIPVRTSYPEGPFRWEWHVGKYLNR